jgi:integrase
MAGSAITTVQVEKFIKAGVPSGKLHNTLRDGQIIGLGLRLLPSGSASWQFAYRVRGGGRAKAQQTVTLGRYPSVSVASARAAAKDLAGQIAAGHDPRSEIKAAAQQEQARVSDALDDYEKWITEDRKLLKAADMMASLRRGLRPFLKRNLADLNRQAFVDRIEAIARGDIGDANRAPSKSGRGGKARKGGPGAAGDFRKFLHTFLERAVSRGLLNANVMAGHRMPSATKADRIKAEEAARLMTKAELIAVWQAACAIGGPFGGLVRMAIATGLRRGELAAMQWDWIDRDAGTITVPASNMKAGATHIVPITKIVSKILDDQPHTTGTLVFPTTRRLGGATQLSGWSQWLGKLADQSDVRWVTMHDFRRFFRSQLSELSVPESVAETMIAHKRSDLVARYNRAQLLKLRADSANTYDEWLQGVLNRETIGSAKNVVSLRRAK